MTTCAVCELHAESTFKIDGMDCYKIFVTLSDGFEKYLFVDAGSFMIVAGRGSVPIHAFGAAVTTEGRTLDYQPTNGVLMPHRMIEVELATGKVLSDARNVVIEANTIYDPSIFIAGLVVLMATAACACALPAFRAARIDPLETIGGER